MILIRVVELFITKFSCLQKITDLTLSNSNLDNSSTDYLSKTISQFPTLTVLGFVGKALFFDELIIYSRNLNSLSISSLILTDSRNIETFPIAIENLYQLEDLFIKFSFRVDSRCFQQILKGLSRMKNFKNCKILT